ncbi:MAG TPA: hypothetical protein VFP84_35935 [Kofleriaceae bacterium]|nr:hypothetical protein [Kofleriaceae bacterium]
MRSRRAICVSRDIGWRRAIEDSLSCNGIAVDHRDGIPVAGDAVDAALVIVDRATREAAGGALGAIAAPVVIVGDDLDDDAVIAAMLDAPVSHLVVDPRDRDLGITSEKLATGDVFGLEKYVAPGTPVGGRVVLGDADKQHALDALTAWADARVRAPIVHRLRSAADELMMNALYDAPVRPGVARHTELRWAADADVLAISVGDRSGALRQRDVLDHVRRARHERGRPRPESGAKRGAGLGLYLVVANVASLVINVEVGKRTEVVCLFDRAPAARPAPSAVRSLHVFQAAS